MMYQWPRRKFVNRKSENGNKVVFIVGLYKSGTSLITKLCEEMSFSNLDDLWPGRVKGVSNEYYTYESESVNQLNEKIIRYHFGTRHRLPPLWLYAWINQCLLRGGAFKDEILTLLHIQRANKLVIKDPQFCITLPLWLSTARNYGLVKIVWVIRNHANVVRSWFRDEWCIKRLHLRSKEDAFKLSASYEKYLLKQYHKFSPYYDSLVLNLEAVKHEPIGNIENMARFLDYKGELIKAAGIIKR